MKMLLNSSDIWCSVARNHHLHAGVVVDIDGHARRCHVSAADGLDFGDAAELRFIQQLTGEEAKVQR